MGSCFFLQIVIFTVMFIGVCGLPVYPGDDAPLELLVKYYFALAYSHRRICGFLQTVHGIFVSIHTLKRLVKRLNLRRNRVEAPLPEIVQKIIQLHGEGYDNLGNSSMWKLLNIHCGIRATRETVRLALREIDPMGVELKHRRRLRRRRYYNRGPNYAVHIDGYDKLKPYGIAIHGAIDGFSRKILWLKAGPSNNNPRHIVAFYLELLSKYNRVPRVIQSDGGTENVFVRDIHRALRLEHGDQMSGVKRFLVSRSTSNQRIERLWASLKTFFTQFWRNRFSDLRETGTFSDTDPLHVECLRFCFLHIIQEQLDVFSHLWNSHNIRSQRDILNPTGIPDVMFFQPEEFGGMNYSFPLPTDIATVRDVTERFTAHYPTRGCSADFLQLIQMLTGSNAGEEPLPQTAEDAENLFTAIVHVLNFL